MRTLDTLIAESPVFAGLPQEQLEMIAGCTKNVIFDAGERIFKEGDEADTFYVVRSGLIALEQYVPNQGVFTVETIGPGEIAGWSWLVPPYRWQLSARAVNTVRAIVGDGACLRGKCEDDHELGYLLLSRISGELVQVVTQARLQLADIYGSGR